MLFETKNNLLISEIKSEWPQFASDRLRYEKIIIIKSLQWRINNPSAGRLSVRDEEIQKCFPYLPPEAVSAVRSSIRKKFYSNKDDQSYGKYWNHPALSKIFADVGDTAASLNKIFVEDKFSVEDLTPVDINNSVSLEFDGLTFGGRLKSEEHFYHIIDAIKNF
jgi:hypothetical protein